MRWGVLAGLCVSAALGAGLGFLAKALVPFYLLVVTSLAVWNLISTVFIVRRKRWIGATDLVVQILADVGAVTLLLSVTGGIYNPLSSFLLVYAAMAALLLRGTALVLALIVICGSLGYLQWNPDVALLDLRGAVTRPVIFLSYSIIALIWAGLTRSLSRSLQELEVSIKALQGKQERLDRLKLAGAMAAGFSHEFSTPLYTLKLRLDRVQRAVEDARVPATADIEAADEALVQCERILKSLTETGLKARHLSLEVVPLASVIGDWVKEYEGRAGDVVLRSSISLRPSLNMEIPVQPLKQSFFDLLDNACEATVDGQRANSRLHSLAVVEVDAREFESKGRTEVHLSIINEGAELSNVVLEKWGEPFVTTKENGTGLGLFNALTLVQAMGGRLEIIREPKSRTRVRLAFPRVRAIAEGEYESTN
jgi:two-component system sensor histidine kinase RegB